MSWHSDCEGERFNLRCRSRQSSNVTVTWDVAPEQPAGEYRVVHRGVARTLTGTSRQLT